MSLVTSDTREFVKVYQPFAFTICFLFRQSCRRFGAVVRFISENDNKRQPQTEEGYFDPGGHVPVAVVVDDAGQEWSEIGRKDESACPDANLPCMFCANHEINAASTGSGRRCGTMEEKMS